jgi:hypothetical protein
MLVEFYVRKRRKKKKDTGIQQIADVGVFNLFGLLAYRNLSCFALGDMLGVLPDCI